MSFFTMNLFPKGEPGTKIPWWSGVAYRNYYTNDFQLAPIGIAKLWSVGRSFYHWLQRPLDESTYLIQKVKILQLSRMNEELRDTIDLMCSSKGSAER